MAADDLLTGLDEAQRRAVSSDSQPLIIRAGAGTGKTRVLTRRVAYRAATGALDPRHVLCVTFTREAAGELRHRLRALGLRDLPAAGTFHGVALGLLRIRAHDQRKPMPELLTDRGAFVRRTASGVDRATATRIGTEIDWARARLIRPDRYRSALRKAGRRPPVDPVVVESVYRTVEQAKRTKRLIDFDDVLERCAEAFERDPAFAAAQRWRFRHLFVDEFQDVNPLQFRLLEAWMGEGRDLTVVGDANQSIYGWNGAEPTLFTTLAERLGGEVVELAVNHRSTAAVVAVAAAALGDPAVAPTAAAPRGDGPRPHVVRCASDHEELITVARAISRRRDRGVPWRDQAVLVRTNAQAAELRDALDRAGIPVRRPGPPALAGLPVAPSWADLLEELASHDVDPTWATLAEEYAALDDRPTPEGFRVWLTAAERGPDQMGRPRRDEVTVTTFHAAKGREWRAVIVAGVEAGFVPASPVRVEEEQRLFYVALSRAIEQLDITWAARRMWRGRVVDREPSPFLDAVTAACDTLDADFAPRPAPSAVRRALPPMDASRLAFDDRLAALQAWRQGQARAASVQPVAVLPDDVLVALATDPPGDAGELAARPGVGALRAGRLAPGVLRALHAPSTAPETAPARRAGGR